MYLFTLYGLQIQSDFDFQLPKLPLNNCKADLLIQKVKLDQLQDKVQTQLHKKDKSRWYTYSELKYGAIHLCWPKHFEFLVHQQTPLIEFALYPGISRDSLAVYLLAQALSFSLIHFGLEPLHAAVLEYQSTGFAIMGESGVGKSCLTASLLQRDCKLVSDDVLVTKFDSSTQSIIQPGCPHIKMFPDDAHQFLPEFTTGAAMNQLTSKLIIDLPVEKVSQEALPLKSIFVLRHSEKNGLKIQELHASEILPHLMANCFNTLIQSPERLKRQLTYLSRLIESTKTYLVDYPHQRHHQTTVGDFILSQLTK